jgi:hypothetical protein
MFLLKSTLAFLLMLALTIVVAGIAQSRSKAVSLVPAGKAWHWRALWTFLIVFTGSCLLSPMTISIRHFTIPILLLILSMAPVPRILERLAQDDWTAARVLMATYALLAITSIVTIYRHYPYFLPFMNHLGFGRPAYTLINDSNLDWNQALPDVERFVRERGIPHVLIDEYGFIDPAVYVMEGQFWDCQAPQAADAGQWAVVSAGMIEDGANCLWLLNCPHVPLAGGGMYAFQLPAVIPPVGDPMGPPPIETHRNLGGAPGPDLRLIFLKCIRDPNQLQPTMDWMMHRYQEEGAKRKAEREAQRKAH